MLEDQADIRLVGRALGSAADQAADLLLVYFVGHGLVAGRRHDLYLGLPDSEWARPGFNSLEYDKLRSAVLDSAAATKIIILDCCFSGRVVSETMANPVTEMVDRMEVDGTYVLASAGRDQVALILPGEDYTAFTGRFLHLLRNGVPGGPEFLTVDYLYQQLRSKMRAEGLSQPQKRGTSTANLLALARNRALAAPAEAAGRHPQDPASAETPASTEDGHREERRSEGGTAAATGPETRVRRGRPLLSERRREAHKRGYKGYYQGTRAPQPPSTRVPRSFPHLTLAGHTDWVSSVAFHSNGRLLASGSADKTVRLWDPATGEHLRTLTGHDGSVLAVAFSPDGRLLASGGFDATVRLWDPGTGELLRTLTTTYRGAVGTVAFSPDGQFLASGGEDDTVQLWNPTTGEYPRSLTGHNGSVLAVAFSPDGRLLASGSYDKTVLLWDPATGEHLRTPVSRGGPVWAVAFSPDRRLLASGSTDKTVRLWDPATGRYGPTLTDHSESVTCVAFNSVGRLLASGSGDKTVRLWDFGQAARAVPSDEDAKLFDEAAKLFSS